MVFSFGNEREHRSLVGNLGFPVRDAPLKGRAAQHLPAGKYRMKAYGSCEQGLRSMPINPKVEQRRNTIFGLMAEQYSRPSEQPDPTVVGYSEGR